MRGAFFDLDETILDRSGSLRDFAMWQATGMLSSDVSDPNSFVDRFVALDQKGMVWKDKVYESLIDEFNITGWSVQDLLSTYVLTFCAFCKARKGAVTVVEEFRNNGFKIGLVSNGKTPFQERNFNALGFSELFDSVIVSDAVGLRKPEKAIFELACREVGVKIGSSVFIGDNPIADMKGAKNAGMKTVYVPIDSESIACDDADYTVGNLLDLASYVSKIDW